MEGFTLKRRVMELLQENSLGSFMNDRTTFDYIYDAVMDFNKRTHYLTNTQTINVAGNSSQNIWSLNPDFVCMAFKDRYNQEYIKYTVSGSDNFVTAQDYSEIVLNDDSSTSPVISSWSIIDAPQLPTITGTTSSAGAINSPLQGECLLNDTTAPFANVYPGDFVHDTTEGCDGVIIGVNSTSQLICVMFNSSGSTQGFGNSDSYVIVPQSRYQLLFTPIPSVAATATIPYVPKPLPVYSIYRAYKLPNDALLPISQFAVFLYKYKDRDANFGDALYKYYDLYTRRIAAEIRRGFDQRGSFSVNMVKMNKRSTGTGQWR